MAKKRKRMEEKKEEREYKSPEFDRREYVKTEVGISKATILSAIFSIPMGLAAMFIMPVGGFGSGLMAGIAGIGILWFLLPLMNLDTKAFKPMNWAGIFSTYFMVFLAVWVISCNPPFNDFASPNVHGIQVGYAGSNNTTTWVGLTASETGGSPYAKIVGSNITLTIQANVTDNGELNPDTVTIRVNRVNVTIPMEVQKGHVFKATIDNVLAGDSMVILAEDMNGNKVEYKFDIRN